MPAASADAVRSDLLFAISKRAAGLIDRWRGQSERDLILRKRFYLGLDRVPMSKAIRAELLLAQIQDAIDHQCSWRRPWQRYEPLSAYLDSEIWPTDQTVLMDLSFAKLAIEILSESQRRDLDAALAE